jgi:3-isopropylmalate/(R)-2-methylmalate dehydratase small subunit
MPSAAPMPSSPSISRKQEIRGPDGGCLKFEIDPFRKQCLLNGWDDIGLTLRNESRIRDFEAHRKMESRGYER